MPRKPTVIITGANGLVGTQLVQYFASKGWSVKALVRNPKRFSSSSNVTYSSYSLEKPVDPAVFKGADYLIHTAFMKQDRKHPDAFKVNVKAAASLLQASRKYKLKKNLFMSSMSAHDEAISTYGKQKLAIEKLFDSAHDINFRSGLIIGDGGIVRDMTQFMKSKHAVPLIGGGKQPLQVIGVYDLVTAIERGLTDPSLHGTFTVATSQVYTYRSFYQAIAQQQKLHVLYVPVPFWVLMSVIRTATALHVPLDFNEDNLLGLKKLIAVDNKKDLAALRIKPDSLKTILRKTTFS